MELEINGPKLKGFTNPLTKKGEWALVIVLGAIVAIAGVVYVANFGKRKESTVLPATSQQEATATPQSAIPTETPTITPLTEEETSSASPSPTIKVQKPTETPTPAVEGVTVTPAPTI